jgi:hypothetical protein
MNPTRKAECNGKNKSKGKNQNAMNEKTKAKNNLTLPAVS